MRWSEFTDADIVYGSNGDVLTDIECPECNEKLYMSSIVLTIYPPKYNYYCSVCGWSGNAFQKWEKRQ